MIVIKVGPGDYAAVGGVAEGRYSGTVIRRLWPLSATPVEHHQRVIRTERISQILHAICHALKE